jgi:hypothetical protein
MMSSLPRTRRTIVASFSCALLILLAGCGMQVPTDPEGSLDRLTGDVMQVGASIEPGLVEQRGDTMEGSLVDLIEGFAETRSATIEWTIASEESLVALLEQGQLDVAVGGMTEQTLWTERVGVTRGYSGIAPTQNTKLVMFVPLGENRLLSTLERYLDEEVGP